MVKLITFQVTKRLVIHSILLWKNKTKLVEKSSFYQCNDDIKR